MGYPADDVFAIRTLVRHAIEAALLLPLALCFAGPSAAATIYVTTEAQGVTDPSNCSLQEAIYSSEFTSNIALAATLPDRFYTTGCIPGTGDDTIVLPTGGSFQFDHSLGDSYNYMGPTATPIIFSKITIEGNGSTLYWTGSENSRLFAIGGANMTLNGTVSGYGDLSLENVYVVGFHVKGGDGGSTGGGGGLGAGGAIYVDAFGSLTVGNSTFAGNSAVGGNGAGGSYPNGGGGGLSGNGGTGNNAGGGGGGARGNGGNGGGGVNVASSGGGGAGGGTLRSGGDGTGTLSSGSGGSGGYACGGNGGDAGNDGQSGQCAGGGGGGGGDFDFSQCSGFSCFGDGLTGAYGGGGGGGGSSDGGSGGFGGGGGGGSDGFFVTHGGHGGFGGGGGGACCGGVETDPGGAGEFGGNASGSNGGGGGALGGAIFSFGAIVTVRNSTFTNDSVAGGAGGDNGHNDNGKAAGGAIFAVNGYLSVQNSTLSGNQQNDTGGGGITFYTWDDCGGNCVPISFCNHEGICVTSSANRFTLDNTIIANNGPKECQVIGTPDDNTSLTVSGAGNLIMQNDSTGPCPGVVSTSDPNLQPLTLNSPGNTPTMAILANSPAKDTGDSGVGIAAGIYTDQRGVGRPQDGKYDIGAYEARDADFSFAMVPTIPVGVGGSVSTTVTVNSFEYFSAPVVLSVPTTPAGVSVSFSTNPVTPSANGSASTTMTITLAPTVTPGSYTPTILGNAAATATSAALTHSFPANVVVSATTGSISTVIVDFVTTKSIDNSGIAKALNSKLTAAQAYINIGDKTDAIGTLGAMIDQLNAQSGKHITAPAAAILITDTQALQSSLE